MPFNLLLLPLIGGYLFVTQWYRTRYYALRADGQRLLLNSACAGAVFLFAATLLVGYCESSHWGRAINLAWHRTVPFEYSGRAVLAFLLGAAGWWPLNRIWVRDAEIQRVILEKGDALEGLLRRAVGENRLVALTVKSGKVYIGWITGLFNPAFPLEHIKLVPAFSGYRREPDKHLIFTNFYLPIYEKLRAEQQTQPLPNAEFELVLPRTEIQSANLFDLKIYEQHFRAAPIQLSVSRRKRKTARPNPAATEIAP